MTRLIGLLILMCVAGCAAQPPAAGDVQGELGPGLLFVFMHSADHLEIGSYAVSDHDLPDVVKLWGCQSAIIIGYENAQFGDAVREASALKAAGISDVTIADWTANMPFKLMPATDYSKTRLRVDLEAGGRVTINGYSVADKDLPDMVKLWHVRSAFVEGFGHPKFSDAQREMAALKSAGVSEIAIER